MNVKKDSLQNPGTCGMIYRTLTMGFLRIIRKDIKLLNQLGMSWKIVILILGTGVIFAVWYPGIDWWRTPVPERYFTRNPARWELPVVVLAIIFCMYILSAVDRYRKSR